MPQNDTPYRRSQMTTTRRSLLRTAAGVGLAAPFLGLGVGSLARAQATAGLKPIKFASNASAICLAPVFVARDHGIFEKHGLDVEIVTWSVRVEDERPLPETRTIRTGTETASGPTREVFDPAAGRHLPTTIVDRGSMTPGAYVAGPAIIVERETSTVVTYPFDVTMQDDRSLLLTRKDAA